MNPQRSANTSRTPTPSRRIFSRAFFRRKKTSSLSSLHLTSFNSHIFEAVCSHLVSPAESRSCDRKVYLRASTLSPPPVPFPFFSPQCKYLFWSAVILLPFQICHNLCPIFLEVLFMNCTNAVLKLTHWSISWRTVSRSIQVNPGLSRSVQVYPGGLWPQGLLPCLQTVPSTCAISALFTST